MEKTVKPHFSLWRGGVLFFKMSLTARCKIMVIEQVATIVGALKLGLDIVEVGKDIWNKLEPPKKLADETRQDGVYGSTYYSGQYRFTVSIPDERWQFWEPSPQFIASLGILFAMPVRAIPIMVLSREMVKLYRPYVTVVVEDVGSFTSINEITDVTVRALTSLKWHIDAKDIHISESTNSAALIMSQPYLQTNMFQVQQIYLYASRGYYVTASYVPISDASPTLFGGLRDVMNSFQLIK